MTIIENLEQEIAALLNLPENKAKIEKAAHNVILGIPEFENIEEIERHPIDIELQKCEAIIKQTCIDMLHLVGIDISEVTLDVSDGGNSWFIGYDGIDLFECHIGALIRSFQKRENENDDK